MLSVAQKGFQSWCNIFGSFVLTQEYI